MIPDFKGHHFVKDWKPDDLHHGIIASSAEWKPCSGRTARHFRCGSKGRISQASDRVPLNALPVPPCNIVRPRPA